MTQASVIVPARNAEATLGATLAALEAQRDVDRGFEVIVVDDHSTDSTAAVAAASRLRPRVVSPRGRGAAEARNAGVRAAHGAALAFTDADCEPDPAWLATGLGRLGSADLVQGSVQPAGPLRGPWDRTLSVAGPTGLFESANLFVTRELFDRVGGFEHWLGSAEERPFAEDTWFGWRAHRAGARIAFSPLTVVRHAVFPGTWRDLAGERWRLRYFPPLVARVPELREHMRSPVFLSARTASFDAALAGICVAARVRSPLPLIMCVPYARRTIGVARLWGRRRLPGLLLAHVGADAVGFLALGLGSARARRLLI